jgi:hypothetical protein
MVYRHFILLYVTVAYTPFARLGQMGVYALFVAFLIHLISQKRNYQDYHS